MCREDVECLYFFFKDTKARPHSHHQSTQVLKKKKRFNQLPLRTPKHNLGIVFGLQNLLHFVQMLRRQILHV